MFLEEFQKNWRVVKVVNSRGVHDLRMDGGLPLGFQKGTPF